MDLKQVTSRLRLDELGASLRLKNRRVRGTHRSVYMIMTIMLCVMVMLVAVMQKWGCSGQDQVPQARQRRRLGQFGIEEGQSRDVSPGERLSPDLPLLPDFVRRVYAWPHNLTYAKWRHSSEGTKEWFPEYEVSTYTCLTSLPNTNPNILPQLHTAYTQTLNSTNYTRISL